ncbi:MAG: hypothetical protein ACP5NS_02795 [Candidatus Pacearchaeota archaeon]
MDLKEFLKPTKPKIGLTLLIGMLLSVFFVLVALTYWDSWGPIWIRIILGLFFWPLLLLNWLGPFLPDFLRYSSAGQLIYLFALALQIFYVYIFACIGTKYLLKNKEIN